MGRWHILPSLQPLHCVLSRFDYVQLIATPQTVAIQAPLSMGFSKQEYWSELLFLSPGDIPNPRIEPAFLASPALAGRFFSTAQVGKPDKCRICLPHWRPRFDPWVGKIPWRRRWQPTPVFLLQGQRSLARLHVVTKESDTT